MDLKDKILEVIKGQKLASVATIAEESDQIFPAVRYMRATGSEDLTLSAFTKIDTKKVSQIEKNPNVALMIASEGDPTRPYVAIRATAEVHKKSRGPHVCSHSFHSIEDRVLQQRQDGSPATQPGEMRAWPL